MNTKNFFKKRKELEEKIMATVQVAVLEEHVLVIFGIISQDGSFPSLYFFEILEN